MVIIIIIIIAIITIIVNSSCVIAITITMLLAPPITKANDGYKSQRRACLSKDDCFIYFYIQSYLQCQISTHFFLSHFYTLDPTKKK